MPTDVPPSPKSSMKEETAPSGEEEASKPTSSEPQTESESVREGDSKSAGCPGTGRSGAPPETPAGPGMPRGGQGREVCERAGRGAARRGCGLSAARGAQQLPRSSQGSPPAVTELRPGPHPARPCLPTRGCGDPCPGCLQVLCAVSHGADVLQIRSSPLVSVVGTQAHGS